MTSSESIIGGLKLKNGEISQCTRSEIEQRISHAKVAGSMALEGKRILDIGCDSGLYSLYFAD